MYCLFLSYFDLPKFNNFYLSGLNSISHFSIQISNAKPIQALNLPLLELIEPSTLSCTEPILAPNPTLPNRPH